MSSIEALTQWNDGVIEMEKKNYTKAISIFEQSCEVSAKILFNCAMCYFVKNNIEEALENMKAAIVKDEHLAIGYHFRGILLFKLARFEDAVRDFEMAHKKLRGKNVIDYNQLGCRYKFYAFESLFNCGVSWSRLNTRPKALDYLLQAQKCKIEKKHEVVEQTILKVDQNKRTDIIDLPAEAIFRPPKSKLANLKKKDYLGKAKVISAVDTTDTSPGFEAPRKMSLQPASLELPVVNNSLSRSAPSSPRAKRKARDMRQNPDNDKLGVPLSITTSRSASDLQKLQPASRKPIPPPPDKPVPEPPHKTVRQFKALPELVNTDRPSKPLPEAPSKTERPGKPLPEAVKKTDRPNKPVPLLPPRASVPAQTVDDKHITSPSQRRPVPVLRKELPPPDTELPPAPPRVPATSGNETTGRRAKPLPTPIGGGVESTQDTETSSGGPQSVTQRIQRLQLKETGAQSMDRKLPVKPPKPEVTPALPPRNAAKPKVTSPGFTNTAPLPPKPKALNKSSSKATISVEITCNHSSTFNVTKGESLSELLSMACEEFVLEPGTVDLWYQVDEECTCIENDDEMTRVWAAVSDKLSLFCFSKQD